MKKFILVSLLLTISCATDRDSRFKSPAYRTTPNLFTNLPSEETAPDSEAAKLTFTNTSKWSVVFDGVRLRRPKPGYIPEDAWKNMNLTPPPKNTSLRTMAELDYLEGLKKYRTPKIRKQILRERERGDLKFGHLWGYQLGLWTHDDPVSVYLTDGLRDLWQTMIYVKEHFNRVRPEKLRPSIEPMIITPHHPSFPSGHTAEYYGVALLLGKLDPANAEVYKQDALRIAVNREIAGVHYPSDSASGVEVATKVVDLLFQNPGYVKLFNEAKVYWDQTNGKRRWP